MEDPVQEIGPIIHSLTQSLPTQQELTLLNYFTPTAQFTHPFCRTGSFEYSPFGYDINSRWAMIQIYQWYKILSPRIDLRVKSVAFDQENLLLYVTVNQQFRLWFVPGYVADVWLTTVLGLTDRIDNRGRRVRDLHGVGNGNGNGSVKGGSGQVSRGGKKYYIESQNDLYQTSEWIKFLVPWGLGVGGMIVWQLLATVLCVLGAVVLHPVTWLKERTPGAHWAGLPRKEG